jgi:CubicO group peptidase (beta-lactamase class C family)
MRRFVVFSVLVLLGCASKSQDFDKDRLDSLFSIIDANQKGMGSVAIFKGGKEVYHHSVGFADIEKGLKANPETKYRIGSISKTFTSAIVMQLVEEGKLSLDARLADFYPGMPNADVITIEQMLRHRSGLYNFTNSPAYLQWMVDPKSEEELIKIFVENGTVFSPGEKFEYSNTNYVLLSFIIEKVEKKPLADVLADRITKPLGLASTYYGGKIGAKPNEARSYTMSDRWAEATETDMSIPTGAGAIVSTPADLCRFFNALFKGEVVSKESLDKMTDLVDGYGLGLFQIPFYERKAYGHNGGIDGFQSNASYFPEDDVVVAYTTNGTVMAMNDILIGLLSIYFDKNYDFPTFAPVIDVASEDLDQYLGIYSSKALPLKITVTKNGNQLMAQATGQGAFPLQPYEAHKFRFDQAGIKMEFIPDDKKMILIQGGGRFEFILGD